MSVALNCDWIVEVFFDGQCPLCVREIKLIDWLDRKSRIRFTDISDPSFAPSDHGLTMKDFMDEIRGRLADGTRITGVEVFRQLYSAVGFGPVVWITRAPGISHALEFGYRVFARNRLRLTGRCRDGSCDIG